MHLMGMELQEAREHMAEQTRKKDAKNRDLQDEMSRAAQNAHERELDLTRTAEQHRESLKQAEGRCYIYASHLLAHQCLISHLHCEAARGGAGLGYCAFSQRRSCLRCHGQSPQASPMKYCVYVLSLLRNEGLKSRRI
jgi:hypothetical protein